MPEFPTFRKLSNEKSFYKILSDYRFEEIQRVGSTLIKATFDAVKYPEILRVRDMVSCSPPFEQSSEIEYNGIYLLL